MAGNRLETERFHEEDGSAPLLMKVGER